MKDIPSPVERRAVRKQSYYHFNVKQSRLQAEMIVCPTISGHGLYLETALSETAFFALFCKYQVTTKLISLTAF